VAKLTFSLWLSCDQCQYETFDVINARFFEPVSNLDEDVGVQLECIIESRGIDEDDRITISGVCNSDGLSLRYVRLQLMTHGMTALACSPFDELQK
jgi:hypothetical protein